MRPIVTGTCSIEGEKAAIGVCDARFLMSSMGHVVGEKITCMVERATKERIPVIIFACSGGARMQEGCVSLMQMAKTAAALKKHSEAGLLYVPVLTDPPRGSDGKLCHVRRHHSGGAGGAYRLCGAESDRADDWTKAAQRFSAGGISERAWFRGQCGRKRRFEKGIA